MRGETRHLQTDFVLHEVSWKLVLNNFQSGQESDGVRTSLFIHVTGVSRPQIPSRRPTPLELCKARGLPQALRHSCAKSLRPTASEFCQRRTCSLPRLKAELHT